MNEPIRVLLVEDEEMVRISLKAYLEDDGFFVEAVSSGEIAAELLEGNDYDIAIVDMRLPNMDGNSFIMRAHELKPKMKYIIHTGSTTYKLPYGLMDIGISGENVYTKPLPDMGILVTAIRKMLSGADGGNE